MHLSVMPHLSQVGQRWGFIGDLQKPDNKFPGDNFELQIPYYYPRESLTQANNIVYSRCKCPYLGDELG